MVSWAFSHLESGLVRLASDAGHVLDMHPAALLQMTASELLLMLERRVAEGVAAPEQPAPASAPVVAEQAEQGEGDGGQA